MRTIKWVFNYTIPHYKICATFLSLKYWRGCTLWQWESRDLQKQSSVWLQVVETKGVELSTTLAWPGWKQPDIPVEVDTARLETSRFKNGAAKCVLLYYHSSEFKSVVNVYWHGEGAARLSCTELSIWEFPSLRGGCRQWASSIWYWILCKWDAPEGHPGQCCVHLYASAFYWCLSPQFQISLSAVTLVYLSQCLRQLFEEMWEYK